MRSFIIPLEKNKIFIYFYKLKKTKEKKFFIFDSFIFLDFYNISSDPFDNLEIFKKIYNYNIFSKEIFIFYTTINRLFYFNLFSFFKGFSFKKIYFLDILGYFNFLYKNVLFIYKKYFINYNNREKTIIDIKSLDKYKIKISLNFLFSRFINNLFQNNTSEFIYNLSDIIKIIAKNYFDKPFDDYLKIKII